MTEINFLGTHIHTVHDQDGDQFAWVPGDTWRTWITEHSPDDLTALPFPAGVVYLRVYDAAFSTSAAMQESVTCETMPEVLAAILRLQLGAFHFDAAALAARLGPPPAVNSDRSITAFDGDTYLGEMTLATAWDGTPYQQIVALTYSCGSFEWRTYGQYDGGRARREAAQARAVIDSSAERVAEHAAAEQRYRILCTRTAEVQALVGECRVTGPASHLVAPGEMSQAPVVRAYVDGAGEMTDVDWAARACELRKLLKFLARR
jgi:hypothetical protein